MCANSFGGTNIYHSAQNRVLYSQLRNSPMQSYTDPCTMALESDAILWDLLNETPGEIYDVDDIEEEKFDVEQYINGNTDY